MASDAAVKIEVVAESDVGCVRTNNEDSFGYDLETRLFVVCDGMGGVAAGEMASGTAVRELVEHFAREPIAGASLEERLQKSIFSANHAVYTMAQGNEELRGMGTTLVAACLEGQRLVIGNVGDSRAYFIRNGVCAQITTDHSFVNEQVRIGSINAEEAESSPLRSVITRAVGTEALVEPDIFAGAVQNGDVLLLTTDGLTRYADSKVIAEIIGAGASLTVSCKALIDVAKRHGAVDNVTCLLVQFFATEDGNSATEHIAGDQQSRAATSLQ
ncbi:MAG: Stp1/IreP family PP2C-type Ser/Thr phosphatase [Terracidiphilus sp.]|nr:Stp1/IreP family PP2C-type Ser/Thr phosphatase [Terracidiphilus sp.]